MTHALSSFSSANGSTPDPSRFWMQQSVQQFFSHFNWENQPPELLQFQCSPANSALGCSLRLTVSQFFSTVNWEGSTIAAIPTLEALLPETPAAASLTLDDFSDLF